MPATPSNGSPKTSGMRTTKRFGARSFVVSASFPATIAAVSGDLPSRNGSQGLLTRMVSWPLMDFQPDAPFNPDDYVQPERFPDSAEIRECRFCARWLVVPTGDDADCGRHRN